MNRILAAATLGLMLLGMGGAAGAQGGACDRTCLTGVLDTYLAGVIRHDPAAAGLGRNYRGTENARAVLPGQGLWRTVVGLGDVQRRYLDTTNGSAAYFGTISEAGGGRAIVTLRIKLDGQTVQDAEWIIARQGEALYNPNGLIAEPPPAGPILAADRASRTNLQAAANSYFSGLQEKNGALVLHVPGCVRLENGTKVTQRTPPAATASASAAEAREAGGGDCASGLERFAIRAVAHRRFPVIDEVQGVAVGYGMFLRPADSRSQRLLLSEVFTTKGGKITGIYAAMYYMPADLPETMGWPD